MATNPMQRKARNSFLLGMLVMLIIAAIVIGFLVMMLVQMKKAEQELQESYIAVYTLNTDVKAGGEITLAELEKTEVVRTNAPTDYLTPSDLGEKNIAKISLTAGTVMSKEMIYTDNTATGNDVRKQEYNMIILPTQIQNGDYIDIRLTLPTGEDYIVISKKKVEIPQIAGIDSEDTIWLELTEAEILTMSNAIVEAYMINGSKLYATTYTEAGLQEAATPTYAVSRNVLELINSDSNIVQTAREELWSRYNADQRNGALNNAINNAGDQAQSNVESGVQESITNSKETRQEYLDSLM